MEVITIFFFFFFFFFFIFSSASFPWQAGVADAARPVASRPRGPTFNVMRFGARADGRTDDTKAFVDAWTAACSSAGPVTLKIPRGTYLVGPINFNGPCRGATSVTVKMQGTLKASTNLNLYKRAVWIQFGYIANLKLTGGGTFDGQGATTWPLNNCAKDKFCKVPPTSVIFASTNNTVVERVRSVNSKFFHFALLHCNNFYGRGFDIVAPEVSINTDGIHLEGNDGVTITRSAIATGDDCISIGQGNSRVLITSVTCGPGHGISIGSLGKYKDEGDVRGLIIRDSVITGTMFGVRIKTWESSPASTALDNVTFSNIIMRDVSNPIFLDQTYCPFSQCDSRAPSRVQISNVKFEKIRGTTTTPVAVVLHCSKGMPCKNVKLHDVQLNYVPPAGRPANQTFSSCLNVRAEFAGKQIPPPCPAGH